MLTMQHVETYIRQKPIVKDITFTIAPGSIVGLIGPNGAGKTTLMKTILGLTKFSGTIQIAQAPVTETDHRALRRVGALIEHPAIYPFLTGLQNLELYSQDPTDRQQLITTLEMDGYIRQKAKGYSLGMKQKLGIAIAFLNHPQLIILDEPMNGLDVEATIGVRQLIHQYAAQGTAFLISSHILSELQRVMTQVILINHGQLIVNQPLDQFNQLHHQNYQFRTTAPQQTRQLLETQRMSFTTHQSYFSVRRETIFALQDLLATHHIYLEELAPVERNLEQTVVAILAQQREAAHEN